MRKTAIFILVLLLILLQLTLFLGMRYGPLIALAFGLLAYTLWRFTPLRRLAFDQIHPGVWVAAGLFSLASLFLPLPLLVEHPSRQPQTLQTISGMALFPVYPFALVIAAQLLRSGLNLYQTQINQAPQPRPRLWMSVSFALAGLILVKLLHSLYWLLIWDSANDAFIFLFLFLFWLPYAVIAGLVLTTAQPARVRSAGLAYTFIVPALLVLVYLGAQSVDFRQITQSRAGRIARAVEAYHAAEGSYPQTLQSLVPRYALSIPEPVILYGEDWCYQSGADYYRLGAVYREHWSSPELTGRVYAQTGAAPGGPALCADEIAVLQAEHPEYWTAMEP
jgi:hypothetical protein